MESFFIRKVLAEKLLTTINPLPSSQPHAP